MKTKAGRRAIVVLAVLVGATLPTGPVGAQATGATLKVLTWNIHSGNPDRLAEVIEASGADVVALQEVDVYKQRSGCRHQAFDIAEHLGMDARLGANIRSGEECGAGRQALYGDALLSRHPILEWRHVLLPNHGGEQRGLVEAVLDVDGQRVRVVSTHLEYGSASERRAQAEAVVEHLKGSAEPVVVMGDLNGEPDDSGLAPLRDAFTDAWTAAGDGDGFTNPSSNPRRRIDYVFVAGPSPAHAAVLNSTASDHLAVRADLVL
ncbi:MAG: endonuclease/exonuclease/phosphatase family protein [Acidimicrobiia bacterium]